MACVGDTILASRLHSSGLQIQSNKGDFVSFLMYLGQQVYHTLKYYRGFLLGVYIVGAVVVMYCLLV
jgi:hypothetical protein